MKKIVKVIVVNNTPEENMKGKLTEEWLNSEYEIYEEVITKIIEARMFILNVYGVKTPDNIWDRILEEVVKLELKDWINNKKKGDVK